jgi:uncharacterized membrane protein YcaP (DUF421 family)
MIDGRMFFDGWHGVLRTVVIAVLGYMALIVILRLARKRSLAQMNVFDFVCVIVVGDLLAITIMDEQISLTEGIAAIVVLVGLQILLSWLTTRSTAIEHVINGEPTLLMRRGRFLHDAMRAQRVTESEIRSAAREEGVADLAQVEAVVMETNGTLSILHFGTPSSASTLSDVADTGGRGVGGSADGQAGARKRRHPPVQRQRPGRPANRGSRTAAARQASVRLQRRCNRYTATCGSAFESEYEPRM